MNIQNGWNGPTLYFKNYVDDKVVNDVKQACEEVDTIIVSFDVTGRTCHQMLGGQLAEQLGDNYNVVIDWNYYIAVNKRRDDYVNTADESNH